MADEHFDRLESFRVFIKATEEGAPVPPVNRDDLKRLHEIHDDFLTQHPDKEGTTYTLPTTTGKFFVVASSTGLHNMNFAEYSQ